MYGQSLSQLQLSSMRWVAGRPLPAWGYRILRRYLAVFGYPSVAAHLLHPLALKLLDIQPADCLLDAGCGKALLTTDSRVASCRRYFAVDAVPGRVSHARHLGSELAVRAGFAAMDIAALAFSSAIFDKAICLEVIEHIPNDQRGLDELFRVLRPGGRLVLSTAETNHAVSLSVEVRHRDHVRTGYTRAALEAKVIAAGFQLERSMDLCGPRATWALSVENAFVGRGLAFVLPFLFPFLWLIARHDEATEHVHQGQLLVAVRPE